MAAAADAELIVEFVDETHVVSADATLSFGRAGDVVVDDANPFMHRIVGVFVHEDGRWWLRNEARRFELQLRSDDGRRSTLPPGAGEVLSAMCGTVQFTSGVTTYELMWELDGIEAPATSVAASGGQTTREFGVVSLNTEQRQLLVALAEPRLRGLDAGIPANAEVAHRLGWSLRKFDRKLDYLCRRLSEAGVKGLRGQKGEEAVDRRTKLLDHVLAVGMVSADDLDVLESPSG